MKAQNSDPSVANLLPRPVIDPDIAKLLRTLTEAEYAILEKSLKEEGCRDPIVIWKETGILLDGHNRLKICTQWGIRLETKEISLSDRNAAIEWVIHNQLARRNLTTIEHILLALKFEPFIAERAKAHQRASGGAVPSKLKEAAIDTCAEVAKLAGVSTGTLRKVMKIEESATENMKQMMRDGVLSIDAAYKRYQKLGKILGGKEPRFEFVTVGMERLGYLRTHLGRLRDDAILCGSDDVLTREERQQFLADVGSFLSELQTTWLVKGYDRWASARKSVG